MAPVKHDVLVDGHHLAVWEKKPAQPRAAILLVHGRTWSSLPNFDLQVPGERRSVMDALVGSGIGTADKAWVVLPGADHAAHLEKSLGELVRTIVWFIRRHEV